MTLSTLERKKLELVRLRSAQADRLASAFDGNNLTASPTPAQDTVLRDIVTRVHWIVCANRSGKSQTGSRLVAWWFLENHPYMQRPAKWRGPLQILVIGRILEQLESEIWEKKIKPFLPSGSYKVHKSGGVLKRVHNLRNGNVIIFMSHHDAINAADKVQAFTANVVWLDEMPDHAKLVSELLTRTVTLEGRFYATFTPLVRNAEIKAMVEAPRPSAKRHTFLLLDNPLFASNKAEIEAEIRANCSSEAEFRARMFGEWYEGDQRVSRYDREINAVVEPPEYERTLWRHVAVADPSASGRTGLTVWGEHPKTGNWYCVKAIYLKGTAAYDLFDSIERELVGFHLTHRWTDCNPAGFYKEAARRGAAASGGVPWVPYTDKSDRKLETLDKLNAGWQSRRLWLTQAAQLLEDELVKAEWANVNADRITNATSYHLLDTTRYFYDIVPKFDPERIQVRTQDQEIRQAWKTRKAKEAAHKARMLQRRSKWTRRSKPRSFSWAH